MRHRTFKICLVHWSSFLSLRVARKTCNWLAQTFYLQNYIKEKLKQCCTLRYKIKISFPTMLEAHQKVKPCIQQSCGRTGFLHKDIDWSSKKVLDRIAPHRTSALLLSLTCLLLDYLNEMKFSARIANSQKSKLKAQNFVRVGLLYFFIFIALTPLEFELCSQQ